MTGLPSWFPPNADGDLLVLLRATTTFALAYYAAKSSRVTPWHRGFWWTMAAIGSFGVATCVALNLFDPPFEWLPYMSSSRRAFGVIESFSLAMGFRLVLRDKVVLDRQVRKEVRLATKEIKDGRK